MRKREKPDWTRVTSAVANLLSALGFDLMHDEGLRDTPERVSRAYQEFLSGYDVDGRKVLERTFPGEGYDQVVVLRNVPFMSLCEHHLVPFAGVAAIAYLPGARVVGLSKLARVVEAHARRLQIQEAMTQAIADDIEESLSPKGVAVLVRAQHLCMTSRGVQKPGAEMVTSALRGAMKDDQKLRAETMELLRA